MLSCLVVSYPLNFGKKRKKGREREREKRKGKKNKEFRRL